jgi:hypothetical protein
LLLAHQSGPVCTDQSEYARWSHMGLDWGGRGEGGGGGGSGRGEGGGGEGGDEGRGEGERLFMDRARGK